MIKKRKILDLISLNLNKEIEWQMNMPFYFVIFIHFIYIFMNNKLKGVFMRHILIKLIHLPIKIIQICTLLKDLTIEN